MIVQLNTKANFFEIIKNQSSGILRTYLLAESPKNKLEKIVRAANAIKGDASSKVFIEVKYPLGRRDKRIEIVCLNGDKIIVYKISKMNDFDESYFELIGIMDDMGKKINTNEFSINGSLIFLDEYNHDIIDKFISNQELKLTHHHIRNFK